MKKSYCVVNGLQAEIIEVNGGWTIIKYIISGQTAKVRNSAVTQITEVDEVTEPLPTTTDLERAMVVKIARSEFTSVNGAIPKSLDEVGWVWANVIIEDAADKGVFTSLLKKGLVEHSGGVKSDMAVTLTDRGFQVFLSISAEKAPIQQRPTRKNATPAPSSVLERSTKVKSSRLINPDRAKYVRGLGVTETGLDTVDINDEAAQILRGLTLEAMYEVVPVLLVERGYKSKSIKSTTADAIQAELRQMYGHLNHGQQRMNLGNRLRAALKGGK